MPRNSKKGSLGKGLSALIQDAPVESKDSQEILLSEIVPNPNQPRQTFDDAALYTLAESIRQFGLVQPIVVRRVENHYQIVAGERRWRACKSLGLSKVPVIIKDYSTEETTEIALVENLQREGLDSIEEAHAYSRLIKVFKLTQEMVAQKVGRSRSHVANMLRLLQLPEFLQDELSGGDLTIGQVRPLLGLKTEDLQKEALLIIKEKDLNARQIENLIKRMTREKSETTQSINSLPEVKEWEKQIQFSLGMPVGIKLKKGKKVKGKIEISFASEEEFLRVMSFFEEDDEVPEKADLESFRV